MKSDDVARTVLEELGFSVRKLPEESALGKRADFIVKLDQHTLLVEAKLRKDEPAELERMEKELAENKIYGSNHQLGNNNALSSNIRDAVAQLKAEQEEPHDYKVLLYLAACLNAHVVCEQIMDTLYGTTTIWRKTPSVPSLREIPCYFYRENEFHPAKSLDAAIVGFKSGDSWALFLCLNPFSNRFNEIHTSALARMFDGRIVDPIAEEAQGRALIPDHDAPRPSKERKDFERTFPMMDGMLRHLEEKYEAQPFTFLQGHFKKPILILRRPP
jgi:hypothetical protein